MLFELRPGHAGKGSAGTHLLKATELGGGLPIFIGDDVTDEEGFLAATRHNGAGILAGAPRPTAALYRLEGVAAVRGWLSECRERLLKGGKMKKKTLDSWPIGQCQALIGRAAGRGQVLRAVLD